MTAAREKWCLPTKLAVPLCTVKDDSQSVEILRLAQDILSAAGTVRIGTLSELLAFVQQRTQQIPIPTRAAVYRVIQAAATQSTR